MSAFRPAVLLDAPRPARFAAWSTLLGFALLPWTLTLPDSPFGAWWILTIWVPALATVVLAPREVLDSLRGWRDWCLVRAKTARAGLRPARRLHLPRAGAGAVRVRLRRPQGVRMARRRVA